MPRAPKVVGLGSRLQRSVQSGLMALSPTGAIQGSVELRSARVRVAAPFGNAALALALCLALLAPSPARADLKSDVRAKLESLLKTTRTMTWTHTTWEKKGKDIETTTGNVWWQGIDKQRIDVTGGRGEGRTVILTGTRLDTGMITFDYNNRMVLSLRGNTVRQNGYLDDLELALKQWERATVTEESGLWVLGYTTGTGLASKLWFNAQTLAVTKNESTQNGEVVERYEYSAVKYNPALPDDIFED